MGVERGELNPAPGYIACHVLGQRWLLRVSGCSPAMGLCWRIGEGEVSAERQSLVPTGLQGPIGQGWAWCWSFLDEAKLTGIIRVSVLACAFPQNLLSPGFSDCAELFEPLCESGMC